MDRTEPPKRPNVLFVSVDQWPASLMGVAGHPTVETPTLDALASVGTRFTRAYSETPICIPARRSMMTGTSPRKHGDREFQTALPMPAGMPTLAGCFGAAGYQTFAVGKLHVYPQRDRIGFDDALIAEEGRSHLGCRRRLRDLPRRPRPRRPAIHARHEQQRIWLAHLAPAGGTARHELDDRDGRADDPAARSHAPGAVARLVHASASADRAAGKLCRALPGPAPSNCRRSATGRPDPARLPHALRAVRAYWPQLKPAEHADMLRAFYAQCTHIDHQLRILIGTLREEELLDDTVILVTGDHGDMLGTNGPLRQAADV